MCFGFEHLEAAAAGQSRSILLVDRDDQRDRLRPALGYRFRVYQVLPGRSSRGTAPRKGAQSDRMSALPVFAYQTRWRVTPEQAAFLGTYAARYGRAKTISFYPDANWCFTKTRLSDPSCVGVGSPAARRFNAIWVDREGKIGSIRERRPTLRRTSKGGFQERRKGLAGGKRRSRDRSFGMRKKGG